MTPCPLVTVRPGPDVAPLARRRCFARRGRRWDAIGRPQGRASGGPMSPTREGAKPATGQLVASTGQPGAGGGAQSARGVLFCPEKGAEGCCEHQHPPGGRAPPRKPRRTAAEAR
jgi:hypothetical protein